jgi:hypothetical protein
MVKVVDPSAENAGVLEEYGNTDLPDESVDSGAEWK